MRNGSKINLHSDGSICAYSALENESFSPLNSSFPALIKPKCCSSEECTFISSPFLNQTNLQADRLVWSESEKLTYRDFRAASPPISGKVAATNYEITFDYELKNNEFEFNVQCNFVRNMSWMKKEGKTAYILNHEQKHFDLAEVYARILRKRLSEANINMSNYKKKTESLYNDAWKECLEQQVFYDEATEHSMIEAEQKKWDKKIAALLVRYDDFAN